MTTSAFTVETTPHPPTPEKIPVLVYTDDARDVDDVMALAYLAGAENIQIASIVTTHMIPDRRAIIARAFMAHLGEPDVPIGVGSIFPIGKEDEALVRYLREHTIQGKTYEGDGLIECFPSAEDVIMGAIKKYGNKLKIAALAPLTDLAQFAQRHPKEFATIGGLFIQGQATVEEGLLVPDPQAYNIKEDEEAATIIFGMQDRVAFTFFGKFGAYQVPLGRNEFNGFAATGNPAGLYLKNHAIKGLQCFAERAPEIFQRVFGVAPSQLDSLDELSKPYDVLTAMTIANPENFTPTRVGRHALIGMTNEHPGIINSQSTKLKIVNTIMQALTGPRTI